MIFFLKCILDSWPPQKERFRFQLGKSSWNPCLSNRYELHSHACWLEGSAATFLKLRFNPPRSPCKIMYHLHLMNWTWVRWINLSTCMYSDGWKNVPMHGICWFNKKSHPNRPQKCDKWKNDSHHLPSSGASGRRSNGELQVEQQLFVAAPQICLDEVIMSFWSSINSPRVNGTVIKRCEIVCNSLHFSIW